MTACDGGAITIGYVLDSDNQPITNALVKVEVVKTAGEKENYQCEVKTDKDGKFNCVFLHPLVTVQLRMTISKQGYKTYEV